jgi:hypothetical protein
VETQRNFHYGLAGAFLSNLAKSARVNGVKEADFLKKVGIYSRYLTQFLNDGDVAKILETIRELEKIRQQADKEKVE